MNGVENELNQNIADTLRWASRKLTRLMYTGDESVGVSADKALAIAEAALDISEEMNNLAQVAIDYAETTSANREIIVGALREAGAV